jgi:hypothetical protein
MSKAQITLFLIIGIVVAVLFISMLYFSGVAENEEMEQTTQRVQKEPSELEPLANYVQQCIEAKAKKGLLLLGKQGGKIYEQQGGYSPNPFTPLFVEYESRWVPYRIRQPLAGTFCETQPPLYPTASFIPYPYGPDKDFQNPIYLQDKTYERPNCFGDSVSFDKDASYLDLKYYVASELYDNCPFDGFPQFQVQKSRPSVQIEEREDRIDLTVDYPLSVQKTDGSLLSLSTFTEKVDFSLSKIFDFANEKIRLDVTDPRYDITIRDTGEPHAVFVRKDAVEENDIVSIKTDGAVIDGNQFELQFARRNRPPALEYVYDTNVSSLALHDGLQLHYNELILQPLAAHDPDEDTVQLQVWVQGRGQRQIINQSRNYTASFADEQRGTLLINITATDGVAADYQVQNQDEDFIITT